MSENKMCNHCNKFTADEIVKGDIFCLECGHQRDKVETSPHQKSKTVEKKEYWKRWWYIGIWILLIYLLIPFIKQNMKNSSKVIRADEWKKYSSDVQGKVITNKLKLSDESRQQLDDLMIKAHSAIMNNLQGQDKDDFLRISSLGGNITQEESNLMTMLNEKAKISMSTEDREIVEQSRQQARKLMK